MNHELTLRPVPVEEIHTCSECGRVGAWDLGWSWFGTLLDEDRHRPLVKTCTVECRMAYVASHPSADTGEPR